MSETKHEYDGERASTPGGGLQAEVNAHFDSTASYWDGVYSGDSLQGIIYQDRQMAVLEYIDAADVPAGGAVLEIGCGAGHLTMQLADRGLRVDAIDASAAMVDTTSARADAHGVRDRVSVKVADVHQLPYDSGHVGLVLAVGVIPWLHSPAAAVAEMARVLRPGGQLVLTADNAARLSSFTDPRGVLALTPLRRVYHTLRNRPGEAVSHLHFPRRIDRFLSRAGLQTVAHRTIGFGPLSLMGRPLFGEQKAIRVNNRLQALADAGTPGLKWTGWDS